MQADGYPAGGGYEEGPPPQSDPRDQQANERRPPVYRSEELLRGHREVWIEHGEEMYRLRLTSAGRLYLTK